MRNYNRILFTVATTLLLTSCGNDIEEIKSPSTGKLLKRFEYYTDDSGQKIKDGEYFEWDAAGNKLAELHYQDDSLNGSCIYHNQDGTVSNYNYSMGKINGEQSLKAKNGNWICQEQYKNGILDGLQTYYHESGKKQCSGSYALGKQIGIWNYFDDKGKSSFNLKFKNGICQNLIGTWILEESGLTSFIFRKDGSFTLKAPYFKFSREAVVQGQGVFTVAQMLKLVDENNGSIWEYEVFDVSKDKMILINSNAEIEESILSLKRVD